MREYKIIKQKINLLKSTGADFENEQNDFARDGWHVISATCFSHIEHLKVVLERDKNR